MNTPTLCKKHFFQVASHFDKELAFEYQLDGDTCLICNKVVFLEGARRFIEQNRQAVENAGPAGAVAE